MAERLSNRNLAGACNCYGWLKHYHIDVWVYNHTVTDARLCGLRAFWPGFLWEWLQGRRFASRGCM